MIGAFLKKIKDKKAKIKLEKQAENILTCIEEMKVQLIKIEKETDKFEQEAKQYE